MLGRNVLTFLFFFVFGLRATMGRQAHTPEAPAAPDSRPSAPQGAGLSLSLGLAIYDKARRADVQTLIVRIQRTSAHCRMSGVSSKRAWPRLARQSHVASRPSDGVLGVDAEGVVCAVVARTRLLAREVTPTLATRSACTSRLTRARVRQRSSWPCCAGSVSLREPSLPTSGAREPGIASTPGSFRDRERSASGMRRVDASASVRGCGRTPTAGRLSASRMQACR